MADINTYRVTGGEDIELPSDLTEGGVAVHGADDDWIVVVEDTSAATRTYTRHRDVATADPSPPKAGNVVVLRLTEDEFDYLEAQ